KFDFTVAEEAKEIPERAFARIFRRGDVQHPGVVRRHPVTQLLAAVRELLRMALRADRRYLINEGLQRAQLALQSLVIDQPSFIHVLARQAVVLGIIDLLRAYAESAGAGKQRQPGEQNRYPLHLYFPSETYETCETYKSY